MLSANSIRAWDISTAKRQNDQEFSLIGQDTSPQGFFLKPDGLKMYLAGNQGDDVKEYSLSTAWDISTAIYSQSFSVSSKTNGPSGVFFKPDGLKMYVSSYSGVAGDDTGYVFEYGISIAWDISSASYTKLFGVAEDAAPADVFFSPDGLRMYVLGNAGASVHEYSLSTAWDISTASFVRSFSVSSQDINPKGLFFKPDGLKMYVSGLFSDAVYEYSLSTAWDISTAAFVQSIGAVGGFKPVGDPEGVFFREDGLKMYVTDSSPLEQRVRTFNIGKQ